MSGDRRAMDLSEAQDTAGSGAGADPARDATAESPPAQMALHEVITPLAIAGMLTCLAISLNQFILGIAPTWPGGVFAVLVFLVSLESIHAHRLLKRLQLYARDRIRYRFVEWVVILLAVRLSVYFSYGSERLASDLARWSVNIGALFDVGFVIRALLIVAVWVVGLVLATIMEELEASPIERMPSVTDPNHYLRSTMPHHGRIDRQARLNRIMTLFLVGGLILLMLAGMSRVDVRDLIVLGHSRSSGIILNVLIYFVIGFLLISEARFTILKANWDLQSIPVRGPLGQRWLLLLSGFLLLVALISAVLPVGYSVGIIATVSTVVRWAIYVLVQIVFFVIFLFSYAIGLLLSLFSTGSSQGAPAMRRAAPPQAPTSVSAGPAPWWQLVRSLIFWTVLVGIIGYSLFHFAGYRLELLRKLSPAWL